MEELRLVRSKECRSYRCRRPVEAPMTSLRIGSHPHDAWKLHHAMTLVSDQPNGVGGASER